MDATKFYKLLAVPTSASDNTLEELKSLTENYPWFSLAHQLLMEVSFRNEDEIYKSYSANAIAYTSSRQNFYWRLQKPTEERLEEEEEEFELFKEAPISPTLKKKPIVEQPATPQFVVVGGDYFSSADFNQTTVTGDDPVSRFIISQPKINPNTSPLNEIDYQDAPEKRRTPMDYVTETLAKIYLNQQLYNLAIDTYKKLILQIPEKNTYFAAQIKEIKKLK